MIYIKEKYRIFFFFNEPTIMLKKILILSRYSFTSNGMKQILIIQHS